MKEITILSGKGGTGKTSITAALASLAEKAVLCDNDVDAADLHLILKPVIQEEHIFEGAWVAQIDQKSCTLCGICIDHCRFNAIHRNDGSFQINPFQCEGCRLCERTCPAGAIHSKRSDKNSWYISDTRFGTFVHARMAAGEENSGKLVSLVRSEAKKIAQKNNLDFVISDGPPGIGCSAISSITGSDFVLLVIEPSKSGLHDAKRVSELVESFKIPMAAIINKYDLNAEITAETETFLEEQKIPLLAKIPFDKKFVEAMIEGKTIVEFSNESDPATLIKSVWEQLVKLLAEISG
ncbi:MAG: ATP-binding protein [Prolixibacteraceae bacterium]|nr:ATP-binding protein [Prolixibacteraceae bacterium]